MITTFDQKIAEFFNGLQTNGWYWGNLLLVIISIFLCVILVGMIGFEREARGRSAGLRTHLLVGVGSCIIMILSIYGFPAIFTYDGSGEVKRDVARLAAGVITGVGFLGAGAIIHNSNGIKGLTTAGTIWISMAIGMACGSMNFIVAILAAFIVMLVLTVFRKIEARITKHKQVIVLIAPIEEPVMSKVLKVAENKQCSISNIITNVIQNGDRNCIELTFTIMSKNSEELQMSDIVSELSIETKALSINVLNTH